MRALDALKRIGNSLFVVEHEIDVVKHADWLVDVGPAAGQAGGQILYSGPPEGLRAVSNSETAKYLFRTRGNRQYQRRKPVGWLKLRNITRNNLADVDVDIPLGIFACVTGVSGSGKSTLISQALIDLFTAEFGARSRKHRSQTDEDLNGLDDATPRSDTSGEIAGGLQGIRRLVVVDQKPIGRTPRSNMATYTGLFDTCELCLQTRKWPKRENTMRDASHSTSTKGRCETCRGEGFVCVELLFLPECLLTVPYMQGLALQC